MPKNRLEQLQALLIDAPNDSFVLFALAKEYEKEGAYLQSLQYFKKLYETNPEYIGLYYHMGSILKAINQPLEAKKIFQEGVKIAEKIGATHDQKELMGALQLLKMEFELD